MDNVTIILTISLFISVIILWGLFGMIQTQRDNYRYWENQYKDMKERYFEILDRVVKSDD